ncbi:MAG TPA: pyrroloquinoline quinone biosynthesis peptide chaperone PqqD [Burkholderiales bacterium]|nr:pyrroloquinoline quinone biosynthesis peptide chaperone PqqD [Burkholderiales bacterium]
MPDPQGFTDDTVFELQRHFRFQWEPAQQAFVLLYPEGMVKLTGSSGEIMKRVDGKLSVAGIVEDLQKAFPGADLRGDVIGFLEHVHGKGWIRTRQAG